MQVQKTNGNIAVKKKVKNISIKSQNHFHFDVL